MLYCGTRNFTLLVGDRGIPTGKPDWHSHKCSESILNLKLLKVAWIYCLLGAFPRFLIVSPAVGLVKHLHPCPVISLAHNVLYRMIGTVPYGCIRLSRVEFPRHSRHSQHNGASGLPVSPGVPFILILKAFKFSILVPFRAFCSLKCASAAQHVHTPGTGPTAGHCHLSSIGSFRVWCSQRPLW